MPRIFSPNGVPPGSRVTIWAMPCWLRRIADELQIGGFADAFAAFQGDKSSLVHVVFLILIDVFFVFGQGGGKSVVAVAARDEKQRITVVGMQGGVNGILPGMAMGVGGRPPLT